MITNGKTSKLREAGSESPELQLIYATAPIGLAFLGTDCRYLMINERLTQICGLSIDDHIGRTVRETLPQVADQVEYLVQTIVRTGESITNVEIKGQRADATNVDRIWMTHWHPLKDARGQVIGVNVAAEEITERKQAEAELAASRARLLEFSETLAERVEARAQERDRIWRLSQDLLVVLDRGGTVLNVNPAWSAELAWSADELTGKSGEWLVHPDDRERACAELASLAAGREVRGLENRVRGKDGGYRWVSWFAVADDGHIYASGRDVTDFRQAREELQSLRRRLANP